MHALAGAHVAFTVHRMPKLLRRFAPAALALSALTFVSAQGSTEPPAELPAAATEKLAKSLAAAQPHLKHMWRDTPPRNEDGTVNAYIEIPRGDRRKWEFNMVRNERAIDRMMPEALGGYPVNYGMVPQTISYDGDPFDALVLGPPLPGGEAVRGAIVGLMVMEDEKGLDSKVVLAPLGADERPRYVLNAGERQHLADYFGRYKLHEPGKFSRVPGWGSPADGAAYIQTSHRFFEECREPATRPCVVAR